MGFYLNKFYYKFEKMVRKKTTNKKENKEAN